MLEKNDLAGDSLKIVPRQYLPLISRGELLRKETFGSTGKCLEVYWSGGLHAVYVFFVVLSKKILWSDTSG